MPCACKQPFHHYFLPTLTSDTQQKWSGWQVRKGGDSYGSLVHQDLGGRVTAGGRQGQCSRSRPGTADEEDTGSPVARGGVSSIPSLPLGITSPLMGIIDHS